MHNPQNGSKIKTLAHKVAPAVGANLFLVIIVSAAITQIYFKKIFTEKGAKYTQLTTQAIEFFLGLM